MAGGRAETPVDRDRKKLYETDPDAFTCRDAARLARALELFELKEQLPGTEFLDLAFLFQHGGEPDHYKKAWELADEALTQGCETAAWLTAAAEDRYLLSIGEKQKWGTQFSQNEKGEWEQQAMAEDTELGITDDLRRAKNVPARSEQLMVFLSCVG